MSQEYGLGGGGDALFVVVGDASLPTGPLEWVDPPPSPNEEVEAE